MKLDRFLAERRPAWEELEQLAKAAKSRPERLGPEGVRRLGSLYRAAAADLAYARRRWPGDPVVSRLEAVVARSRVLVYNSRIRRGSLVNFVGRRYWQLVRERPALLLVGALLLIAPAAAAGLWGLNDPGRAIDFVPSEYQSIVEPRESADIGLGVAEQTAFSALIFTNNIQVTFLAFAGGITAGIATAVVVLYNGAFLGAMTGLAASAGNGPVFLELVVAHGILELSCIVVAASAGLRVGWALIDPGRRRRTEALRAETVPAVEIALGTAPWLVLAGLVEGFVTGQGLGLPLVMPVGVALGALYWWLVVTRGVVEEATRDGPVPLP